MSNISKRRREGSRSKIKSVGDHKEFLNRITKTLYYGQLPTLPCLSLPVTEISCEAWSAPQRGRSLRRLHADAAANIARQACVSPCALVLALLYLERLNACNPDYLAHAPPQDLFLISLMVGNKFLQDDGEDEEVICSEWAASGGIDLKQLKNLEMEFLNAIDWNVFISDKSFEAGLARLERRVAMRQAQARGFFTYSDLAACGGGGAAELAHAAAAACAALALAYLAGLVALLAAALVASHAAAPALAPAQPARAANATPDLAADLLAADSLAVDLLAADLLALDLLAYDSVASDRPRCCAGWARLDRWPEKARCGATEPRPSRSSAWERLSRRAAADPLQRWLGRVDEYAEPPARRWLDLGQLGALMATVTDR